MATSVNTKIINSLTWFKKNLVNSIVNNCSSTSTTLPLSAAQGKVLQDQITSLNTNMSPALKDISGIGKAYASKVGNRCTINIIGYEFTKAGADAGAYNVGQEYAPSKGAYVPVAISGQGAGMIYINSSGTMILYSMDMGSYLTGVTYGTGTYALN